MMSEIKAFTAGFEPRSIGPTLDPPPPQQTLKNEDNDNDRSDEIFVRPTGTFRKNPKNLVPIFSGDPNSPERSL